MFLTKDDSFIYIKKYYKDKGYYDLYEDFYKNTAILYVSDTLYFTLEQYSTVTGEYISYYEKHSLYDFIKTNYSGYDTVILIDSILIDNIKKIKGYNYNEITPYDSIPVIIKDSVNSIVLSGNAYMIIFDKKGNLNYIISRTDLSELRIWKYFRDEFGIVDSEYLYFRSSGLNKLVLRSKKYRIEDLSYYNNFTKAEKRILEEYYINSPLVKMIIN